MMADRRDPLTARQQQVLSFIESHVERLHRAPTLREIGAGLGIGSTNGVASHLELLERKGYIARAAGLSRSIVVIGQGVPAIAGASPDRRMELARGYLDALARRLDPTDVDLMTLLADLRATLAG